MQIQVPHGLFIPLFVVVRKAAAGVCDLPLVGLGLLVCAVGSAKRDLQTQGWANQILSTS